LGRFLLVIIFSVKHFLCDDFSTWHPATGQCVAPLPAVLRCCGVVDSTREEEAEGSRRTGPSCRASTGTCTASSTSDTSSRSRALATEQRSKTISGDVRSGSREEWTSGGAAQEQSKEDEQKVSKIRERVKY